MGSGIGATRLREPFRDRKVSGRSPFLQTSNTNCYALGRGRGAETRLQAGPYVGSAATPTHPVKGSDFAFSGKFRKNGAGLQGRHSEGASPNGYARVNNAPLGAGVSWPVDLSPKPHQEIACIVICLGFR
jgi:hypothetical protein